MATDGKLGRPVGSPNVQVTAVLIPPRCPACGSSRRSKYVGNKRTLKHGGTLSDGTVYTHIVLRNTRCFDCEQSRVERSYENTPDRRPEDDDGA